MKRELFINELRPLEPIETFYSACPQCGQLSRHLVPDGKQDLQPIVDYLKDKLEKANRQIAELNSINSSLYGRNR